MPATISPAEILSENTQVVPGKQQITEYFFRVPLDYAKPDGHHIEIFARGSRKHVVPTDADDESDEESMKKKMRQPYLVYLTGGPGHACNQPQLYPWTMDFLDKGYQMLYPDQRGTGLSTAVNANSLSEVGDVDAQVEYLKNFRADNIVRDCEAIRLALTSEWPESKLKWSVLGSSFGGFCCTTYISLYPAGLREIFIAGGLPPVFAKDPDSVYERLYKKVEQRNMAYYKKYEDDKEYVNDILKELRAADVRAPSGSRITPERFLTLGWYLGFHGGIDLIHDFVLRMHSDIARSRAKSLPTPQFQRQILDALDRAILPLDNNPLYTILHEPIYCQGRASRWSAHRVGAALRQSQKRHNRPPPFTGEMIFPWMLDVTAEHSNFKEVAQNLAEVANWPALYDVEQLARNTVPVFAAVFVDDMYVDFELSLQTAETINKCKTVVTNMAYHDGLRSREAEIVGKLWELRCDTLD